MALIVAGGALPAQTQDSPFAEFITPVHGSFISGNTVEIAVHFVSIQQRPVTKVQVFLDGQYITEMPYETAEVEDTPSFKWDTTRTPNGPHKLDVQLFSGDQYLGMTSCSVTVANGTRDLAPPRVAVTSPKDGSVVSGIIPIIIAAHDESGREPLVSIYVDKSLRCVRNRGPYTYDWDTTGYSNGAHVIEAHAEDDARNTSDVKSVRVTVRNLSSQSPIMIQSPSEKPAVPKTASASSTEIPAVPEPSTTGATPVNSGESKEAARATSAATGTFEVGQTPLTKVKQTPATTKTHATAPVAAATTAVVEKPTLLQKPEPTQVAEKLIPAKTPVPTWKPEPAMKTKPAPTSILLAKAEPDFEAPMLPAPATQPKPEARADSEKVYVVKAGDCIDILSRRLGIPAGTLVAMNDIEDPALIRIGQKLRVPECGTKMIAVRPIFEDAGGTLTWTGGKKRAVHAVCPERDVVLKIGSSTAVVDSKSVKMDRPAALNAGRTMVSESFVTGALGMIVSGD